jgi:hypothetical protein
MISHRSIAYRAALLMTISIFYIIIGSTPPQVHASDKGSRPFSIDIASTGRDFEAGRPVSIQVTITNTSDRSLSFFQEYIIGSSHPGPLYGIRIVDNEGNVPPDTKLGRIVRYWQESSPNVGNGTIMSGKGVYDQVAPGQSFTRTVMLSSFFDLSRQGDYTVQFLKSAVGSEGAEVSNIIKVHVHASPHDIQTSPRSAATDIELSVNGLSEIKLGEALRADIVTKNVSNHPVVIEMGKPSADQLGSTYKVTVTDSKGQKLPQSGFGLETGNANDIAPTAISPHPAGVYLCLLPGESWTDTVNIGKLFAINNPGQYAFQVQRWNSAAKAWVTSSPIVSNIVH